MCSIFGSELLSTHDACPFWLLMQSCSCDDLLEMVKFQHVSEYAAECREDPDAGKHASAVHTHEAYVWSSSALFACVPSFATPGPKSWSGRTETTPRTPVRRFLSNAALGF